MKLQTIFLSFALLNMTTARSESFTTRVKAALFDHFAKSALTKQALPETALFSLTSACAVVSLYFAGETLFDMHLRYADLKQYYYEAVMHMRQARYEGKLMMSESEIQIGAFIQMLSRVPKVYWREIISTAITYGLFKSTKFCAQQSVILSTLLQQ